MEKMPVAQQRSTSKGLKVIAVALFIVLLLTMRMDLPWWGTALWFIGIFAAFGVFALGASDQARHERFLLQDQWHAPLSATDALDKIAEHFASTGATVEKSEHELRVQQGSDVKFRFCGVLSRRGRRAFPSVLTVTASNTDTGATLFACSQDNLGWYPAMHSAIPQWAAERNAHLIDTCRELTLDGAGGVHLAEVTGESADPVPGSTMPFVVIGYLVMAWVAWVGLTGIVLASGDDIFSAPYLTLTAALALLTGWQVQASRKRKREWSTRHEDL